MAPPTTAQQLGSLVKSARDIMRKDKGLFGSDLERLPMLTWIMFLKFLDDMEQIEESRAKLGRKKFKPAIEPPYRWRDWAADEAGITGPELLAFITQEEAVRPGGSKGPGLFAYLRSLRARNGRGDRRTVVASVFQGVVNRMTSGYLLRDVIILTEFNLHTIVRLPNGVFAPYTPIPTNLLFFDRSGPTRHIWYYEVPLPEGRKNYTKTKPMQYEEFADCLAWYRKKRRDANDHAWKVAARDVLQYNGAGQLVSCNLDIKNPNSAEALEHLPPEKLVEDILLKEQRIMELLGEVKAVLAEGPR